MILIVGSAALSKEQLLHYAQQAETIIAADGGLHHLMDVGITPHVILGDFDSYHGEIPQGAKVFPKEKNFSDVEAALKLVGDEETILLGVTGGRLDHFLSAVNLLYGKENLRILDEQNELFFRQGEFKLKKREGYFSLFPQEKTTITIQGAKYNLEEEVVSKHNSLLLSNEWKDDVLVKVNRGWVLVVLSKDKKNPR